LKLTEEPADVIPQPVPAISITKPTAPLPVDLPTVNDVVSLPLPPYSQRSSNEDLEAGRGLGMRTIPTGVVIAKVPPRPSPPTKVETFVDQVISTADDVHIETPPPSVENVTDLLADSAPAMDAVPLQPLTPTNAVVELEASGSSDDIVTSRPSQEDAQEPSTTIRLVGGGGASGIVDTNLADDAVSDPAANVISVASSQPGGIFRACSFGFLNSSWFCAVVAEMRSLFYVLFHPLNTLNLWLEDDPNASIVDVLYLFTTFSAFGVWLVFDRYQKAVNSAVPFRHPAPEVCPLSYFFHGRYS
jgi:hypothetical protein